MTRYLWMTLVAAVLLLWWCLSIADPCLIGFLRGTADPAANPIAITTCGFDAFQGVVIMTNGDVIVRLGALFLWVATVALILALMDPARVKRNVIAIMLVGLVVGGGVYGVLRFLVYGVSLEMIRYQLDTWIVVSAVTAVAAAAGAAIAATTWREEP